MRLIARVVRVALATGFVLLLAFAPPSRGADGTPVQAAATPAHAAPSAETTNRRIVFSETASGYRWKLASGPVPAVGPRQVLIHVRAISINRDDLSELASNPRRHLEGLTAGFDAAGVVVAVGREVARVRVGMRVTDTYFPRWIEGPPSARKLAVTTHGVFADYIALDEGAVVPAPKELTAVEAATLPLAALTAFEATIGQGVLHPGSIVLIEGTGGVSTFAMQFAAAAGARIIQTSSSDSKLERTQAIAKHSSVNYRKYPQWSRRVLALTNGHGADLIVDVGGKMTLPKRSSASPTAAGSRSSAASPDTEATSLCSRSSGRSPARKESTLDRAPTSCAWMRSSKRIASTR